MKKIDFPQATLVIVTLLALALFLQRWFFFRASFFSNLGMIYLNQEEKACCDSDLEDILELSVSYFERAVVYRGAGNNTWRGLGIAYAAQEKAQEALAAMKAADATGEDFLLLGDIQRQKLDWESAIYWYYQAIEREPELAEAWYRLGSVYVEQQDWDGAVEAFQNGLAIDSQLSVLPLVTVLQNRGDSTQAIVVLTQALAKNQDTRERLQNWRALGNLLQDLNAWEEAASVYRDGISEFPNDVDLYIGLGRVLYRRGDGLDAALEPIKWAIELDDTRSAGFIAVAQLLIEEGQYNEADRWFQQALARSGSNRYWELLRANAAREAGNLSFAIRIYEDLIVRYPDQASLYFEVGWAYWLNDDVEQAKQAIEKAIDLSDSRNVSQLLRAAWVYENTGKLNDALKLYEGVIAIFPDNEEALAGIARLRGENE